jgi:DivIVA domain-containing protein
MLTPDEIRVKEFLPSLRGYDADEVRAFLLAIAETMEQLEAKVDAVGTSAGLTLTGEALGPKVTRLSEELELALWTMRRLEATVIRLEERLDRETSSSYLAS